MAAFRPAIVEVYGAVGRAAERLGARWYVFGAHAAAAYGRPRATEDVDITVDLAGASTRAALDAFEAEGITLRFEPSAAFLESTRLLPLVHGETEMPLDVVIAGDGIEREFLARAHAVDLHGVRVPLISVEDLIATKILAGRRKDLDDIRDVLARGRETVDVARVRDVLGALERALNDAGLLKRFERLWAAKRRARG